MLMAISTPTRTGPFHDTWGEVAKGQKNKLMGRKSEEGKEGKKEKRRKKQLKRGWVWWYRSAILRLEVRQRDHEFEGSLGYKESSLPAQRT